MKTLPIYLFAFVWLINARLEDKYDLRKLPFDLRPVKAYVGLWELTRIQGSPRGLPPPDLIDFGINPLPKFGARAINITHTYLNRNGKIVRTDYGFMPVKNASRSDPRVHVAYLTTSSWGFSMMEQGLVMWPKIRFHLKQFMRRSFAAGPQNQNFHVDALERQFTINGNRMQMAVQAMTNYGNDDYRAAYRRLM